MMLFTFEGKYNFFNPGGTDRIGDVFIIGGAEIYNQTINFVDRLYLTEIDAEVDGDIFYPELDMSQWKEISRIHHPIDEKHKYAFDFVIYDNINS
jgi:dihydrofolate reductase